MKRIILSVTVLVFSLSFCKAQYVTIPDNYFRNWLNNNGFASCMNGNDLDTTCSLVNSVHYLNITYTNIHNIWGVQFFDSLDTLFCAGTLTSCPPFPNLLVNLSIHGSYSVMGFLPPHLKRLSCGFSDLTTFTNLPDSIYFIDCQNAQITGFPNFPANLDTIIFSYNNVTSLPPLPAGLKDFIGSHNQFSVLPPLPDSLWLLAVSSNNLTSLPSLPNTLQRLWCDHNQIAVLPSLPASLRILDCGTNQLTFLPAFPDTFFSLNCSYNSLSSLPDLPDSLYVFLVNNNPNLMCIPPFHKFLGPPTNNFSFSNTGITCLPNAIQHTGSIPAIDNTPICSLFNLNGCPLSWNINGKAYFDANTNCIQQMYETNINEIKVKLYQDGNLVQQGYFGSDYSFDTDLDTFTVELDTTDLPFLVSCPMTGDTIVNVTALDSLLYNINFALQCKPGFDLAVLNVEKAGDFFPNFKTPVKITAGDFIHSVYNVNCNSGISGELKVVINGPADYYSTMPGALTPIVTGDTLIYSVPDFSLINPDSGFAFKVWIDSLAQIGNQICFDITVTPTTGDNNISNNSVSHCFEVLSSYDPNEKEVSPVGSLAYPFNDWLTYTIHFQNTGTASAHHIRVFDTLDTYLDASTFQLLTYSHEPMVQLFGNIVHFNYVNINLPDSSSDSEGSKGYVSYRIKPLVNLPLGTTISNSASIYFDFNTPVLTNTVTNLICNLIPPTNISHTICTDESYNFNGTILSNPGNYSFTLNAINGCDSVINLSLTNINLTVQQSGNTLTALSNGTIQWFDCNTQQIISGETGNVFVPNMDGNYAAIISEGNCIDTSACFNIVTGTIELSLDGWNMTVTPNPCTTCEITGVENANDLTVTDIVGRKITTSFSKSANGYNINLPETTTGLFIIRNSKTGEVVKFVVQ